MRGGRRRGSWIRAPLQPYLSCPTPPLSSPSPPAGHCSSLLLHPQTFSRLVSTPTGSRMGGSFCAQGWPHPSPAHPLWLPGAPGQSPSPSACSSPTIAHQRPRLPRPWHHPELWALHPWCLLCHSRDHCGPHHLCPSLRQVSLSEIKGPGLTPPGSPVSPTTGEAYERSGSPFSSERIL